MGEEDFKKWEEEKEIDLRKEEVLEEKIRKLRKERNKSRQYQRMPPRKRRKVMNKCEDEDIINSILENLENDTCKDTMKTKREVTENDKIGDIQNPRKKTDRNFKIF